MITVAEIIILIVGAILFTISFIIPDKGGSSAVVDADGYIDEDAIKKIVDDELKKAKDSIEETTKLSISDSKDKLDRYMDRLTNEKMMAVGEYSDTVMEQIHKDHEEAVFLYDMIDNKHSQVKNTAAELTQLEKDVRRLSENVAANKATGNAATVQVENNSPVITEQKPVLSEPVKTVTPDETAAEDADKQVSEIFTDGFNALTPEVVSVPQSDIPAEESAPAQKPAKPKAKPKAKQVEVSEGPMAGGDVELLFDSDSNSMNNNDRILALHKEGKSNMAIAKELGLGVGEVKLVIDLFKS